MVKFKPWRETWETLKETAYVFLGITVFGIVLLSPIIIFKLLGPEWGIVGAIIDMMVVVVLVCAIDPKS